MLRITIDINDDCQETADEFIDQVGPEIREFLKSTGGSIQVLLTAEEDISVSAELSDPA